MNQSLFLIVGGTHMSKSGSAVDQLAIAYSANSIGLLCLTFCFVEAPIWYFHHAIVDIFPNLFFSFQVQFPLLEISLALLILLTALFLISFGPSFLQIVNAPVPVGHPANRGSLQ
jgi:hypothetical protein